MTDAVAALVGYHFSSLPTIGKALLWKKELFEDAATALEEADSDELDKLAHTLRQFAAEFHAAAEMSHKFHTIMHEHRDKLEAFRRLYCNCQECTAAREALETKQGQQTISE